MLVSLFNRVDIYITSWATQRLRVYTFQVIFEFTHLREAITSAGSLGILIWLTLVEGTFQSSLWYSARCGFLLGSTVVIILLIGIVVIIWVTSTSATIPLEVVGHHRAMRGL